MTAQLLKPLLLAGVMLGAIMGTGTASAHEGRGDWQQRGHGYHQGFERPRYHAPPQRVVIIQPHRTIIAPYGLAPYPPSTYVKYYEPPRRRPHHWRQSYVQVIERPYHYGYGRHW